MMKPAITMKTVVGFVVALCLVLVAVGCDDGGEKNPQLRGKRAALTVDDLNRPVKMGVGEELSIVLPENPTTGYQWRCTWSPQASMRLVKDDYIADAPARVGSGGMRNFVLQAKRAGMVAVTLQYGRWWAGGERDPAKTVMVTVEP